MLKKSLLAATLLFGIADPASAQTTTQQGQMPQEQRTQPRPSPFERADANNDGVITREEVSAARTFAFTRLDVNRDGFLVREEMPSPPHGRRGGGVDGQQLPAREERKMKHQGGELLTGADTNSDGNVSKAEFDAAVGREQAQRASVQNTQRDLMFNRLDANRDGMITRTEADAMRSSLQSRRSSREQLGTGPERELPRRNGDRSQRPNPDTNNDQKVSLTEWLARPDPMFEQGDANRDGRITREEAATFMRQGRITISSSKRPW